MNLAKVDLNLLVVFDALYQTRNVTAAGLRLNRAQPSVSNALSRLRILLGDPLFVRSGGGMQPTPRAHQLMPPIRQVLEQIDLTLAPPVDFDPASARERRFTLAAGDYADITLLPAIIGKLRRDAPGIDIRVSRLDRRRIHQQLARGEVDIALGGIFPGRKAITSAACSTSICCASPAAITRCWRTAAGIWRATSACRTACMRRRMTAPHAD